MRLLLWVPRSNHIKILGSVAAEARWRGHDVLVVAPEGDAKGGDALIHAQAELGGMVPVMDRWRLADFRPQWALAVGLRTAPTLRRVTRRLGVRWAALDHCGDNLSFLLEGDTIHGWDAISLLSVEASAFAGHLGAPTEGMACQGYPELDQLSTVVGNQASCRQKWGLPAGRMVVLLGPAARPIRLGHVRRWWFGMVRYRRTMAVLRRWCDMTGALLVAKTRAKHRDPAWLGRYCDGIVGDEAFYPFTTLELLRAADLYVGFASAMAVEAAALGIPAVHLYGWPPEAAEWPSGRPFKEEFFITRGGLWNCPGSRTALCYGEDWRMRLHETIDTVLCERSLAEATGMRQACARWAGPLDGRASHRLLDLLEARC